MNHALKAFAPGLSLKHFLCILGLGAVVFNFTLAASYQCPQLKMIFSGFAGPFLLMVFILVSLLWIGFSVASHIGGHGMAWSQCLLILSPIGLLFFWPAQETRLGLFIPIGIVISTQTMVFRVVMGVSGRMKKSRQFFFLSFLIATYFLSFSFLGMEKFNALQLFNPKDWAVYDQMFWNTLRGKLFLSSFYGSNLACHNTWFFFFLVPFYYLFPYPLTFLIFKTLLLSLSTIPFYLIAKNIFKENPPHTFVFCFLFYPFLVTQNLNAPHEMGYAPFFILWTYYFYRTDRFFPFLCFLFVMLSIKEHLSAVAVGFGFYAMLSKKNRRWIIAPIVLGIVWGIFSLWVLTYFKKAYPSQGDPSWILTSFKQHYLACQDGHFLCGMKGLLSSFSGIGNILSAGLLLLLPLGLFPPLLSSITLLGMPEVLLDILAKRPVLFSPIWHYNVVSACFLLIGGMEGVKKIADSRWSEKFKLSPQQVQSLLAAFMLAAVMIHSYTWLDFIKYKKNPTHIAAVHEAVAAVPADAFFTVPSQIAPLVAHRERLSILSEGELGDFVMMDSPELPGPFMGRISAQYREIFRKDKVVVYQKNNSRSCL